MILADEILPIGTEFWRIRCRPVDLIIRAGPLWQSFWLWATRLFHVLRV